MIQSSQEAKEILNDKRDALRRLFQGLLFTESRISWPVPNTQNCGAYHDGKIPRLVKREKLTIQD